MIPLPDKKYSVIYADPPWEYAQKGGPNGKRGMAGAHYGTITTAEICKLPIQKIAGGGVLPFPLGNIPKHRRGHQGHGGVGFSVRHRSLRVGQDLR